MMPVLILVIFTAFFPFSAAEELSSLKLIEFGVTSETLAQVSCDWLASAHCSPLIGQLSLPMIPVKFLITFLVTRFTVGPRPLTVFLWAYPCRLVMCLALTALVITPYTILKLSTSRCAPNRVWPWVWPPSRGLLRAL